MGKTLISIPFFVDTITIVPHSASKAEHLDRPISIQEFSQGQPVSLYEIEGTNEWIVKLQDGTFIEGPEHSG